MQGICGAMHFSHTSELRNFKMSSNNLCIYSSGLTVRRPLKHRHHLLQGLLRNRVARRNHWNRLVQHHHHPGFIIHVIPPVPFFLSDSECIKVTEQLHFMDNPNLISFLFLAKDKRQLEPSRNKASINLMMSQLLVVLILGYVSSWLMFGF